MPLRLHDTLERRQVDFEPIDPSGPVTFYTCGPTVYDYAHIGNFRSFLNADVLRRTLEFLGHEVRHVMNITDVGHMTDDAVADGGGEDKMAVAGKRLQEAKKSGKLPEAPSPSWPLPQHANQGPLPFIRVDWCLADFEVPVISPNLSGLRFRL